MESFGHYHYLKWLWNDKISWFFQSSKWLLEKKLFVKILQNNPGQKKFKKGSKHVAIFLSREFSNERTRVERRETFRKLRMRENFSKAFEGYFQWIIRAGTVPSPPPSPSITFDPPPLPPLRVDSGGLGSLMTYRSLSNVFSVINTMVLSLPI